MHWRKRANSDQRRSVPVHDTHPWLRPPAYTLQFAIILRKKVCYQLEKVTEDAMSMAARRGARVGQGLASGATVQVAILQGGGRTSATLGAQCCTQRQGFPGTDPQGVHKHRRCVRWWKRRTPGSAGLHCERRPCDLLLPILYRPSSRARAVARNASCGWEEGGRRGEHDFASGRWRKIACSLCHACRRPEARRPRPPSRREANRWAIRFRQSEAQRNRWIRQYRLPFC